MKKREVTLVKGQSNVTSIEKGKCRYIAKKTKMEILRDSPTHDIGLWGNSRT